MARDWIYVRTLSPDNGVAPKKNAETVPPFNSLTLYTEKSTHNAEMVKGQKKRRDPLYNLNTYA